MMSRQLVASPSAQSPHQAELGKLYEKRVLIDDLIRNLERYAQMDPGGQPVVGKVRIKITNS